MFSSFLKGWFQHQIEPLKLWPYLMAFHSCPFLRKQTQGSGVSGVGCGVTSCCQIRITLPPGPTASGRVNGSRRSLESAFKMCSGHPTCHIRRESVFCGGRGLPVVSTPHCMRVHTLWASVSDASAGPRMIDRWQPIEGSAVRSSSCSAAASHVASALWSENWWDDLNAWWIRHKTSKFFFAYYVFSLPHSPLNKHFFASMLACSPPASYKMILWDERNPSWREARAAASYNEKNPANTAINSVSQLRW